MEAHNEPASAHQPKPCRPPPAQPTASIATVRLKYDSWLRCNISSNYGRTRYFGLLKIINQRAEEKRKSVNGGQAWKLLSSHSLTQGRALNVHTGKRLVTFRGTIYNLLEASAVGSAGHHCVAGDSDVKPTHWDLDGDYLGTQRYSIAEQKVQ